jgi:hypothetical protein
VRPLGWAGGRPYTCAQRAYPSRPVYVQGSYDLNGYLCFLLVEFGDEESTLACPFFAPTHRADNIAFPHPARLPLGASWQGVCSAPGHEQAIPCDTELESCNLGYANSCSRLPKERSCDAVRFAIANDSGETISVQFVLESNYLPAGHGIVEYDRHLSTWISPHPDVRTQKLAESFLQSYLERKSPSPIEST